MGIRVYCGTDFDRYEHEWNQFIELIETAKIDYENSDEELFIIGNVYVGDRRLDAILIKETGISVVDFKSYEGVVYGSENGDWYVISKQNERVDLHQNLYEQLSYYKILLSNRLKNIRHSYFPDIPKNQLDNIKCWGYFEEESSYDKTQLQWRNRTSFDIISRNDLLKKLRFLDCKFNLTKTNIEDILQNLNVRYCEGLTETGESIYESKVKEIFEEDEEKIFMTLSEFCKNSLKEEKHKIISFTTRETVDYFSIEAISSNEKSSLYSRKTEKDRKDAIELLKNTSDYTLILGVPGSGKTSVLKEFYRKSLEVFATSKLHHFPILINLSEVILGKTINDQIIDAHPKIYKEIKFLLKEGRAIIIFDGWDELYSQLRIEIESFFNQMLKQDNKIIISSRIINKEDYPKLNSDSKENIFELVPINIQKIDSYFLSRNQELTKEDITNLKDLIKKSKIETIPLWMDLIGDFHLTNPNEKANEIMLLAYWTERASTINSDIDRFRDLIEEIAFNNFTDDSFRISHQSVKGSISSQDFTELRRIGWLIPAGFSRGEMTYNFVHLRLQEYLCACYIGSNWHQLSESLFDRHKGLLSLKKSEDVFNLTFKELGRRGVNQSTLIELLYQIAGEDNWYQNQKVDSRLLRDPIFALILTIQMELKSAFYFEELRKITEKVWIKYNEEPSFAIKNMLSWLDINQVKKAVYLTNLPLAMKTIHSSVWLGELEQYDIFDETITVLMEELGRSLITNIEYTDKFFYYLRYDYTDRTRWENKIVIFLEHIRKNHYLLKDENRYVKNDQTKKKYDWDWKLTVKNAIYTLLEINRKMAESFIDEWIHSEIEELELFPILEFVPEQLGKLEKIELYFEKWLQKDDEELRKKIVDRLFLTSKYSDFDPESILSDLNATLTDQDYKIWYRNVEYSGTKADSNNVFEWLKPERNSLLIWLCKNESFLDLTWKLPISKCRGLFSKLISLHQGPKDKEEAISSFNLVSRDVSLNEEKNQLEGFLKSKGFTSEIEETLVYETTKREFSENKDVLNAIRLSNHEDEDIRYEAINHCLEENSMQSIEHIKRLLSSDKNEDKHIKLNLVYSLTNSPIHIFDNYIEIGLSSAESEIQSQFLTRLYKEGSRYNYTQNLIANILRLIDSKEREIYVPAAELIEFFPVKEKSVAIEKLLESSHKDLNAIALRIKSASLGLNIHRIIIKAVTTLNYKNIRPAIFGNRIDFYSGYSGYGIGFIFLEKDERMEETKQQTECVNFGIQGLKVDEYAKTYYNEKTSEKIRVSKIPFFFDELTISEVIRFYVKPIMLENYIDEENLSFYKNLLEEKKHEHLLLTTLFHLEEIFLHRSDLYIYFEDKLLDIVKNSSDFFVRGIIQYMVFRYSEQEKIEDLYALFNETSSLNQQSLWWGIGLRDEKVFHHILIKDIETWTHNDIFDKLALALPFTSYSSEVFTKMLFTLVCDQNSILFETMTRYVFRNAIDNRLLYVDWTLTKALGCGNETFLPSHGYEYVKAIDALNSSLDINLHFTSEELSKLLDKMQNHSSLYFKELSDEILLEKGQIEVSEIAGGLDSNSDFYTIFLLNRHFSLLTEVRKVDLIDLFLKRTRDLEQIQIVDNRIQGKNKPGITASYESRMVFLSRLTKIKDIRILDTLKDIFQENKEKEIDPFIEDIREIAQKIWKEQSIYFIEEDIEEVFNWLVALSNLKPRVRPVLYHLSRNILYQLADLIESNNQNHSRLFTDIFFILHDKPYCSHTRFWSTLLDDSN